MAKRKTAVVARVCEGCAEQDATGQVGDLGWLCEDCKASFNDLNEDETQADLNLDEKEIDRLVELDETVELEDEGYIDTKDLQREGFVFANSDEDNYD